MTVITEPRRFQARPGDHRWGKYDYPVTPTQKKALEALMYMTSGLPRAPGNPNLPEEGFYSQRSDNGAVIFGINHQSVTVMRSGRMYANE